MESLTWKTEKRKISDLIPYPYNPRKISEEQIRQLKKSLEKFNIVEIPAINTNGVIIAGHQRLSILQAIGRGQEMIDVRVPNRLLTEDELKEYNLRSNKNTGDWDIEVLVKNFCSDMLVDVGFDLAEFPEMDVEPIEGEDEIPEEKPTNIKIGDMFQLGRHRLLCGDSTKSDNFERLMGEDKANLLLTDPPYNVNYTGKTKDALTIDNDSMCDEKFREFLSSVFGLCFKNMKCGASFYIWHADSEGYNFRGAIHDCQEKVRQCLIWVKNTLVMGRQDYHWKHEPCLYGWKDGASHLWHADRRQTTVLDFDRPSRSIDHPTMKPVALFEYLISNSTVKDNLVIDPFLGSGTSIVACEKLQRKCYGMELSPQYCQVIIDRWEHLTGKKSEQVK